MQRTGRLVTTTDPRLPGAPETTNRKRVEHGRSRSGRMAMHVRAGFSREYLGATSREAAQE